MRKLTHPLSILVVALTVLTLEGRARADDDDEDPREVQARPNVDQVFPYQFEASAGGALSPEHGFHFAGNLRGGFKLPVMYERLYGVWLSPTMGYQFGFFTPDWTYHMGALGVTVHVGNRWAMFTASALVTGGVALFTSHPDKAPVLGGTYGVGGQFFYELIGLRVEHELTYLPEELPGRHRTAREAGFDQQIGFYGMVNLLSVLRLLTVPPAITE